MPAWADPDLALQAAKHTADLYADAVTQLLRTVTRRLAQGIDQPGWPERKLLEVAALRDEANRAVARLTAALPDTITAAVNTGIDAGTAQAAADLTSAGITVDLALTRTNTAAVDLLIRTTVDQLAQTHLQVLRTVDDIYRQVIAEASAGPVLTGTQTRRQAAQRALDRFANQGVTGFVTTAGRHWQLDSYAEMATRTTVGRAQVSATLDAYQAHGRDLVIVSDAPQECEICRPWEGKVLSITGATPTGAQAGGFTVKATRAEATLAGLFHANCRHRAGLFVPGLTRPMAHTADPAGDAARQHQRYLERGIRQWKRRQAAGLDDAARARAAAHVREWQARLRGHVDDHDLKRLRYRETV